MSLCLGQFGRVTLLVRQKQKVIKFWARILKLGDKSLVRLVYNIQLSLDNSGFRTWVSHVRQLLNSLNANHIFNDQKCDKNQVLELRSIIYNKYVSDWYESICNVTSNPKLRTYCIFKEGFYKEPYLQEIVDFKLRIFLSCFRLSCHNLAIEKGRHNT
jgi:pectate lyase